MFFKNKSDLLLPTVVFMIGISVILGAFGSHSLRGVLTPRKFEIYQTACQYLSVHSIGLLLILVLNITTKFKISKASIYSLFFGIFIFCTTLYFISISEMLNQSWLNRLGMITPFGGLLIVMGYFISAINISRFKTNE